jgi:hypothetical protein
MEKDNVTLHTSGKRILLEWLTLVEQLDATPRRRTAARARMMFDKHADCK